MNELSNSQESPMGEQRSRVLHGVFPHFFDDAVLYASRRRHVIVSSDFGATWAKLCAIPSTPLGPLHGMEAAGPNSRLEHRKRRPHRSRDTPPRREPHALQTRGHERSTAVFSIGHKHSPMHRGLCVSKMGPVSLAEYFDNPRRRAAHIYGSEDDGRTWDIAYRFDAGQIRHVHAIVQDPRRQRGSGF